jgi:hypothetical protein
MTTVHLMWTKRLARKFVVGLLRAVVVSYRFDDGQEGSCGIPELQRQEAAACVEAEEPRGQIADLTERLARVKERLSRLVIARETVGEVLSEADSQASSAVPTGWCGHGSVTSRGSAALAVPPWRADLEASALPEAYRDLLEVAEDAGRPLRAGQIAATAGLSTDKAKVEGLRSKPKRLVERGWLAEDASS